MPRLQFLNLSLFSAERRPRTRGDTNKTKSRVKCWNDIRVFVSVKFALPGEAEAVIFNLVSCDLPLTSK